MSNSPRVERERIAALAAASVSGEDSVMILLADLLDDAKQKMTDAIQSANAERVSYAEGFYAGIERVRLNLFP